MQHETDFHVRHCLGAVPAVLKGHAHAFFVPQLGLWDEYYLCVCVCVCVEKEEASSSKSLQHQPSATTVHEVPLLMDRQHARIGLAQILTP